MNEEKEENIIDTYVSQIKAYIDDKTSDYAIILKGEYGKGKTYFMKEILPKHIEIIKHKATIIFTSNTYKKLLGLFILFLCYISYKNVELLKWLWDFFFYSKFYTVIAIILSFGIIITIIAILYILHIRRQIIIIPQYNFLYVSLYGVNSIKDLEEITNKYFDKLILNLKNENEGLLNKINLIRFINWLQALSPIKSVLETTNIKFTESIFNWIFDYKFSFKNAKPNLIICFDDIDRKKSTLDLNDFLGFVNNITENEGKKVILVMHESKLQELNKDEKVKENLAKTAPFYIHYHPSPAQVFVSILKILDYNELDFENILKKYQSIILDFLKEEQYNYRLLKDVFINYKLLHLTIEKAIINEKEYTKDTVREFYIRLCVSIAFNARLQRANFNLELKKINSVSEEYIKLLSSSKNYLEDNLQSKNLQLVDSYYINKNIFYYIYIRDEQKINLEINNSLNKLIKDIQDNLHIVFANRIQNQMNTFQGRYLSHEDIDIVLEYIKQKKYTVYLLYNLYVKVFKYLDNTKKYYYYLFKCEILASIKSSPIEQLQKLKENIESSGDVLGLKRSIVTELSNRQTQQSINSSANIQSPAFEDWICQIYKYDFDLEFEWDEIKNIVNNSDIDQLYVETIEVRKKNRRLTTKALNNVKKVYALLEKQYNSIDNLSHHSCDSLNLYKLKNCLYLIIQAYQSSQSYQ